MMIAKKQHKPEMGLSSLPILLWPCSGRVIEARQLIGRFWRFCGAVPVESAVDDDDDVDARSRTCSDG